MFKIDSIYFKNQKPMDVVVEGVLRDFSNY